MDSTMEVHRGRFVRGKAGSRVAHRLRTAFLFPLPTEGERR